MKKLFLLSLAIAAYLLTASLCVSAQTYPVTEPIEWTWAQAPEKIDAALPNVLLVGDSITRAYYAETAKQLTGKANCYLFATSVSVGDPRLPGQLRDYFAMLPVKYAVVHFNNGMHGWGYSEDQFRAGFPAMLKALHSGAPKAKLVWATITPVRADKAGGASNARINARNAIAQIFIDEQQIPTNNLHALMVPHNDLHSDDVHYNAQGSEMQAAQVTRYILQSLQ